MSEIEYPLVTIMIPTYKQSDIVHRAIESALAQDYPNLEVVVSDDGSPDNTTEAVKKYMYDARLKYFRNDKNLGRVRNYKKCLEDYASGEWVVNCDGDDYYIDNHFISEVMDLIINNKDQRIVFAQGGKVICFPHKEEYDLPPIHSPYQIINGKEYFLSRTKDTFFSHMATLYNRNLALSLNFYHKNILSSDKESLFRLATHGKVLLIKKVYGKWIGHGENFSQRSDVTTIQENYTFIETVSSYALQQDYEAAIIKVWKSEMTLKYFDDWLNKIASSTSSTFIKVKDLIDLFKYLWKSHPSLYWEKVLWFTIFKLPFKLLYFNLIVVRSRE